MEAIQPTGSGVFGSGRYGIVKGTVPDKDRPGLTKEWYYLLDNITQEYIFTGATIAEAFERLRIEEAANSLGETTRIDGVEAVKRRLEERGRHL